MNTPLAALPRSRPRRATGFTLIELMITVAIVAILATIAYPSYRNYVIRGQVINATNGLSALQANMERYYQDNRTYASIGTFISPCKVAAASLVVGNFQLSCTGTLDNANYTLQAQGITGTVAGFTYTVTQANIKNTTITGTSNWNTAGMTCWVIKEGPQC